MNYIAHLSGFFKRVSRDHRLNPTHVSLYMALFQQWNLGRFRNPVSVARSEVMALSRICSRVTYHKCIKELHAWGYIHYAPSYNHFRGSLVYMLGFDERQDRECTADPAMLCTGAVPEVDLGCSGAERELGLSINSINSINGLNKREAPIPAAGSENEQVGVQKERRKEKGCAEKEKKATQHGPPELEAVRAFFRSQDWQELEAFRFFHHYSANGWQLGRTPMQDWQAAARKWNINGINQNDDAGYQENYAADTETGYGRDGRNYSEPL
jgi:hypothetical protein